MEEMGRWGKFPILQSKIQNLKWIDGGPRLRLRYEIKVALLAEEATRVARKSSCTPSASLRPKLLEKQWTANRQTELTSLETN
ncbi:hypothetical protein QT970_04260 [Microcoleus sp. herbarium8]